MPVVQVRLAESGEQEWELIELQGELQSDMEVFDGLELGELQVDAKGGAHLSIGQHRLHGKEEKLSEPLAVLRKVTHEESPEHGRGSGETLTRELEVVAVIRRKFMFKNRPDTVVRDKYKGKSTLK